MADYRTYSAQKKPDASLVKDDRVQGTEKEEGQPRKGRDNKECSCCLEDRQGSGQKDAVDRAGRE